MQLTVDEFKYDYLFIFVSWTEESIRKIGLVGRIGKGLAFKRHTFVIVVDMAVFALRAAAQPVAGIDLDARLGGIELHLTSCTFMP